MALWYLLVTKPQRKNYTILRWIDDHYLALHIQQHQEAIQPSLVIAIGIPKFVSVTGFCLFSGRLSFLPNLKIFFFVSQSGEVSIQNFFEL